MTTFYSTLECVIVKGKDLPRCPLNGSVAIIESKQLSQAYSKLKTCKTKLFAKK